jgi:hypothetical protein
MSGVLNQVMEEIEEYRVKLQKQRIVLNSSLPYARRITKLMKYDFTQPLEFFHPPPRGRTFIYFEATCGGTRVT